MSAADEARSMRMQFRSGWSHRHDNENTRKWLRAIIKHLRMLRVLGPYLDSK